MNKIKKIFISFSVFLTKLLTKIPMTLAIQNKYDIAIDPSMLEIQSKYGVFEPTMEEKISRIGKFAIPIILFVIGLFVILNKKITKKVKVIVISVLAFLAILGVMLMNYISTNF